MVLDARTLRTFALLFCQCLPTSPSLSSHEIKAEKREICMLYRLAYRLVFPLPTSVSPLSIARELGSIQTAQADL